MTTPTVAIPRGGRAAEERLAAEKAARKNRAFSSDWEYLSLAAPSDGELYGESVVVRWVTDEGDWRETRQHSFVNTKDAPADLPEGKKWPAKMGGVCRQSPGFDQVYDECYICEAPQYRKEDAKGRLRKPYAGLRMWAVGVVREPVIGTKEMADRGEIQAYEVGSPVGYVDATYDKEIYENGEATGKTEKRKKFVVANFGLDNFFNALLGFFNVYGTVLDRDYKITRKGAGTETEYEIAPLDKEKITLNGREVPFDLRNPEIAKDYEIPFNLDEIIGNLASDEYYEWFFDTRVESSWAKRFPNSKDESEGGSASESEDNEAATKDTIEKMRAKFKK